MKVIKRIVTSGGLSTALLLVSLLALGEDLYVYPAKGQSDEQLAEDRYLCHRWAVKESGFDPSRFDEVAPPRTIRVPVPKNKAEGAAAKGAITGAVAGSVIGSHDSDAGKGAVIGALIGSIAGAAIEEQGQSEARGKAELAARRLADELSRTRAERALRRSNYRRALTACLEGRGYTAR